MKITELLTLETDRCVQRIHAESAGQALLAGTCSQERYARYLVTAREAVSRAGEFLRGSAEQLAQEGGHAELVALLETKGDEEQDHAAWIDRDLQALGYASIVDAPAPAPAGDVYVAFHQGLRAVAGSGAGFLGTAWILESLSVRLAGVAAANLRAHSPSPVLRAGKGLTFLRGHYAEDQAHVAELAALLERCLSRAGDRAWVELCARFTATVYPAFFA